MLTFLAAYQEHKHAIYTYFLYRVAFDAAVAEDLTSDTFMRVYEHFDDYDQSRPFKPWLYRIAHNALVSHYRSAKKDILISEIEENGWEAPDRKWMERARAFAEHSMLVEKLGELAPKDAHLITLRYRQELTTEEMAQLLGMSEGAVRTALSRALDALRSLTPNEYGH